MQGGIFETSSSLGPVEWKLGGNSFGVPGVIGTLDAQPFVFYAGGSERARFLSSGNFGIGTTAPDTTLHVAGSFKLVDGTQALGYILTSDAAGLASWEPGPGAVVNELDPVIQQQNSPPGGPTTGDRYLVGTAPTGAWVGNANKIAEWNGATWDYTTPVNDDVVYIINAGIWKRFNGVSWVAYAGTVILQNGNSLATNVVIGSINAKALQFKTTNIVRGQFLSSGNFAITNNSFFGGSASASARVQIRGIGATSATYGIIIEDSTATMYFGGRNDGRIDVGNGSFAARLTTRGATNDTSAYAFQAESLSGSLTYRIYNNMLTQINSSHDGNVFDIVTSATTGGFAISGVGGSMITLNTNAVVKVQLIASGGAAYIQRMGAGVDYYIQNSAGSTYFYYQQSTNRFGIGDSVTPTALLHLKADTSMVAAPVFYLQNLANTASVLMNDDGNTYFNSPQYTGFALQVTGSNVLQFVTTSTAAVKARIPVSFYFARNSDDFASLTYDSGNWAFQKLSAVLFSPTAKLCIQGEDATSGLYALNVTNSANTNMFSIRNDTFVGIGSTSPSASEKLHVRGQVLASMAGSATTSTDSPFQAVRTNTGAPNYYSGYQYTFEVGGGVWGIAMDYVDNRFQFLSSTTATYAFGGGTPAAPANKALIYMTNGYYGSNTVALYGATGAGLLANFHAVGTNQLATSWGLRIEDSTGAPILVARNDTAVGVGILDPTGRFHIFGVNSSGVNTRFEPVTGVIEDILGGTVSTTDATLTTIETLAIPTDTVMLITVTFVCRKTSGAGVGTAGDGNTYIRKVRAQNNAGTVTIGIIQSSYTSEAIALFDVSLSVSGTNVLAQVQGSANNNVKWNAVTHMTKVS